MKHITYTLLFICVLGIARASASEQSGPALVSVEFTTFGWGGEIKGLGYKTAGTLKPLDIPGYARSPVFKYNGPEKMNLYSMAETASKGEPKVVGSVVFTRDSKRFTVLIGPGGGGNYIAGAAADDLEKFPVGHARFYNLTPTRVLIRLDQQNIVVLQSGQFKIIAPSAHPAFFVTETAFDRNGSWVRANDDFVGAPTDSQTSIFFLSSADNYFKSIDGVGRLMQMVILREKPEKAEKPAGL